MRLSLASSALPRLRSCPRRPPERVLVLLPSEGLLNDAGACPEGEARAEEIGAGCRSRSTDHIRRRDRESATLAPSAVIVTGAARRAFPINAFQA